MKSLILILTLSAFLAITASARIIHIPDDYSAIQAGIDATQPGDTVLVSHGLYAENIIFPYHNILLASLFITDGQAVHIDSTIIDGDSLGPVIRIESYVDTTAGVVGFTLQHGKHYSGGGIRIANSSPSICYNIIKDNLADDWEVGSFGAGIYLYNSNAMVSNNIIKGNRSLSSYGAYGGGAFIDDSNPLLLNNLFINNLAEYGGGVCCNGMSTLLLRNSIVWGNFARMMGSQVLMDDAVWNQMAYCDIQDSIFPGAGNISTNPMFRDTLGDFHLMSMACGDTDNSPLIDAGHPDIWDQVLSCSWGLGGQRSDIGPYGGGTLYQVGVQEVAPATAEEFLVCQSFPNPFNSSTVIEYYLAQASHVTIVIYDILGRKSAMLLNEDQDVGNHQTLWNSTDQESGIYFYTVRADDKHKTGKMLLVK